MVVLTELMVLAFPATWIVVVVLRMIVPPFRFNFDARHLDGNYAMQKDFAKE